MSFKALSYLLSIRWDICPAQTPESVIVHLKDVLKRKLFLKQCYEAPLENGSFSVLQATETPPLPSLTAFIRRYDHQHFYSINIEAIKGESLTEDTKKTLSRVIDETRDELRDILGDCIEKIPALKRGCPVFNYYVSSDDRVLEYDFQKTLFDRRSKFQHIKIMESKTFGNALFLDDLQNLAEKDLPYTHGLMNYGKVNYKDKDILILGGGDGGLLHELLKEEPKFVTMIDIDDAVVEGCKKYLRGACGSVLDTLKTDKYEIIIDDCLPNLEHFLRDGRKFDVIFNDLTDIPIHGDEDASSKDIWALIKKILNLSLPCLCKNGKYMNHAIGSGCTQALETYENLLRSMPFKLEFSHHSAFVPSFLEEWVFYDITKLD